MLAILLAAGRGSRLAEYNPDLRPKCLLEFGGKSLLQRHLELLASFAVDAVHIVCGYRAELLQTAVAAMPLKPAIVWHHNPRYRQGSTISLLAAESALISDDEVLIMDADVLYDPAILYKLIVSDHANAFLLDHDFEAGPEPVKIAINCGNIVEFRKQLGADLVYDQMGESVGFFRFNPEAAHWIADRCAAYDQMGRADEPHEEVLRDLVLDSDITVNIVDVSGLAWIEIDFPEDIIKARDVILPAIEKQ